MALILVAEDDPEINSLVTLTLQIEGFEVVSARDGEQALRLARERVPDLILLDMELPDRTGFQIAAGLRENKMTVDVPIIFVTARHEVEARVSGLEIAVDYVCKPFMVLELVARVRAALRMRALQQELIESNRQLAMLAATDELTGLCNRRGFDSELEVELKRSQRFGSPVALLMFDIDRFKKVNDTWGHPQGDVVLKHFAGVLHDYSRRIDQVARFGGEEFAALLPETDLQGAQIFAEKVRAAVEALRIPCTTLEGHPAPPMSITVSGGGVATASLEGFKEPVEGLAQHFIQLADRCLYRAKETGRNRVIIESLEELDAA